MKPALKGRVHQEMSGLAKQAYQKIQRRQRVLCGWTYVGGLSAKRMAVYRKVLNGKPWYAFAFRGTVPTDIRDLEADIAIITGRYTHNKIFNDTARDYKRAVGQLEQRHREDPKALNFWVCGHSLGGALAVHVMRLHPAFIRGCSLFNPGIIHDRPLTLKQPYTFKNPRLTCTIYTTPGDIVSLVPRLRKSRHYKIVVVEPQEGMNAHTIDQFTRLACSK